MKMIPIVKMVGLHTRFCMMLQVELILWIFIEYLVWLVTKDNATESKLLTFPALMEFTL